MSSLSSSSGETRAGRGAAPPGPKGWPLIGSAKFMSADPLRFFEALVQEHGSVAAFRLGAWPTLLVGDEDAIETVLVSRHASFVKNSFFWRQVRQVFGDGILTAEGAAWQESRRVAAPAFAPRRVDAYASAFVRHAARAAERWTGGETRDLHADMMGVTLAIAAETLFGADVEADIHAMDGALNDIVGEIASRFARPVLIPDAVPLPGHRRYNRGIATVERIVSRILAERRADPRDRGDLLSSLVAARDEEGRPLSDRQIRDEAVTVLLAGHETTALALSWTLHLLSRHPEADQALAEEGGRVLGDRDPELADLPRLARHGQAVTEAMRLYPPAWVVGREAREDVTLAGYRLAKGTTILISPWVLHRDPAHFPDPLRFWPERWTPAFARALPRFAYMPFGGGPRVCIGKSFALSEAVLILATILRRFRVEDVGPDEVTPAPSITLRPKEGVVCRLHARRG